MTVEEQAIEQAANIYASIYHEEFESDMPSHNWLNRKSNFIIGAESPEAKAFHTKGMYSEEEVKNMIREFGHHINRKYNPQHPIVGEVNEWFEQNKKK